MLQDDWEPVQQYAVNNITHCQVQMIAHRKQGPVLPTLVVAIAPDPTTEKIRKRRSSRAATLVSNKDNGPTVLWFRTDSEPYKLQEWARCLQAQVQPSIPENLPMSPMSPMSPSTPFFQNPFGSQDMRPPSAPKTSLAHKASSSLYITRERPITMSDAPSLRSRRSDLSSLTSSNAAGTSTTAQSYASVLPSDLPSPPMTAPLTAGEPFGPFIEGWTSAQRRGRRPSALSSPVRTIRDSAETNPPLSPTAILHLDSGSSPTPRETILDRAFQMNYIPGSEEPIPGEEKLSSLARFEALMQQVDEQRRKQSLRPMSVAQQLELKSAWDLDDSSDEMDSDAESDDTEGESAQEDVQGEARSSVRPESRRIPGYVRPGGPQTPQQSPRSNAGPRSPISFNPETLAALSSETPPERPKLPQKMQHAHTFSGLGNMTMGPGFLDVSPGKSSSISTTPSDDPVSGLNPSSAYRTSTIAEGQQRHSAASSNGGAGKRLSFSEFTRRLSSTSSMLLVQSNATPPHNELTSDSPIQSRRSSVMQPRQAPAMYSSSPRGGTGSDGDRAERCKSWRSSVGMFGNEGGFL